MGKRNEVWVHISMPNGDNRIASPQYIAQLIGLYNAKDRITQLEQKVEFLERPLKRQSILDRLKEDGKPHTEEWIVNRAYPQPDHWDLLCLVREGELVTSKSGNNRLLYAIPEDRE